jgi:cholestenol Delta-isomerase
VSCFDFFRWRVRVVDPTASGDSLGDTYRFWDRTLLQTAHAEPAVWHAVAALGALQRKWEVVSRLLLEVLSPTSELGCEISAQYPKTGDTGFYQFTQETARELESSSLQLAGEAGTNYVEALKKARSMTDVKAILVLSIALAAASNLTGNWSDSQVHICAATKLISQIADEGRKRPVSELDINDAVDSLARLDLQWLTFQDAESPYPYVNSQLIAYALREAPEIKSLADAQVVLMGIMRKVWVSAANTEKPGAGGTGQGDHDILTDLAQWEQRTLRLLSHTPTLASLRSPNLLFIKIFHATVRLIIMAGVTQPNYTEFSWDNCLAHFERIIALSALFIQAEVYRNPLLPSVVSLDGPGIIMSLWLTAHRCRQPLLRRRALGLLRTSRRQEGMWMSTSAAAVAQKIIEIEESGSPETMALSDSALVPAFCTLEPTTAFEQELIKQFETENLDPQLWLSGGGFWAARTAWDVPGDQLVPLERRVAEVTPFSQPYDPRSGRSKADVTLIFACNDLKGDVRKEVISINF